MKKLVLNIVALLLLAACGRPVTSPQMVDALPEIYPDYVGVTIPATIAPMNFDVLAKECEWVDVVVKGGKQGELHVNDEAVSFP